jgi:hypothetical protein
MVCRVENGVTYKHDYNTDKVPAGGNRISAIHRMDGDCDTGTLVESWAFAGACPEPESSEGEGTAIACGRPRCITRERRQIHLHSIVSAARANPRRMMRATLYILRTGRQWNALSKEVGVSGKSTHRYFQRWMRAGVLSALRWNGGVPTIMCAILLDR